MKDLSNYIESLLDVIKKPCVVKYVDNIYYVDIIYDYKKEQATYQPHQAIIKSLVRRTESMLKTYLPEFKFDVKVKRINVTIKTQEMWII